MTVSKPAAHHLARTFFVTADNPFDASNWHGTTIVSIRKGGKVVVAGDHIALAERADFAGVALD